MTSSTAPANTMPPIRRRQELCRLTLSERRRHFFPDLAAGFETTQARRTCCGLGVICCRTEPRLLTHYRQARTMTGQQENRQPCKQTDAQEERQTWTERIMLQMLQICELITLTLARGQKQRSQSGWLLVSHFSANAPESDQHVLNDANVHVSNTSQGFPHLFGLPSISFLEAKNHQFCKRL